MIPTFITDNLSEDEMSLILSHAVSLKRHGYGEIRLRVSEHKIVAINDDLSENPARLKGLYAGVKNKV